MGISTGVSSQAYPNISPWSPAPIASTSASSIWPDLASRARSTPMAISQDRRQPYIAREDVGFRIFLLPGRDVHLIYGDQIAPPERAYTLHVCTHASVAACHPPVSTLSARSPCAI